MTKAHDKQEKRDIEIYPYDSQEHCHAGTVGISGIDTPAEKWDDVKDQTRKLGQWIKRAVIGKPPAP